MSHYLRLRLKNIPNHDYDLLVNHLFENGAEGVSEVLNFKQTTANYEPEVLDSDIKEVEAFFNISGKETLESLIQTEAFQKYDPAILTEENQDWLVEWKKHYKPFQVHEKLWIYPEWERDQIKKDEEAILINPGLAFGTGTHATTNMCMTFLSKTLSSGHQIKTALDMGAGTGILAILLSKRGVHEIDACEIDEMARENCRENLDLNGIDNINVFSDKELDLNKKYDLVVANIIDGVLIKLKDQLVQATKEKLVLSGILIENKNNLIEVFSTGTGLELIREEKLDEWVCLEFLKK